MKKYLFLVLSFILLCSTIFTFVPTSRPNAYAASQSDDSLAEFLQFEQRIIDLNKSNEMSSYSSNDKSVSMANEFLDTNEEVENVQTSEFSLKRLIVQGNITKTYGAIDKISYNNLHVLCYATELDTQNAYEKFKEIDGLDVIIDKLEDLQEYAEKDYTYTSYKNWGAQAIDVGGYREFLVNENVEDEVVVVVMDTGINTSHSMFSNRLLRDDDGKVRGFSYYDSTYRYSYDNLAFDVDDPTTTDINEADTKKYSFEDDHSHGTHVAGIVCDLTPDNVKILPIKIGGSNGYSYSSIMISAFLRVINIYSKQYNVVCTNLSYSGAGKSSESERDTFNNQCYQPLLDRNILPITAAGNDRADVEVEGLKTVVVSALKKSDSNYIFDTGYSNFGKAIDISAPGTNIYSAAISGTDSATSTFVYKNGTSMACPQVAGVVALLYLNPNLDDDFTALDIEEMLYDNSLDAGDLGKDVYYGHGMLNLKYFEAKLEDETLSFYEDNQLVTEYEEYKNFEQTFTLSIECSNPNFDIIYTTDKTIPTILNSTKYSSSIDITETVYFYVMGIKLENGKVVSRTKIYNISYFSSVTSIEDCFSITANGYLSDYTGNYTHLTIPSTFNGKTVRGLDRSLFFNSNIKSITLPTTCKFINGYAFQYCENLEYIYAPNVTKVYMAAFDGCKSLTLVSDKHPTEQETLGAYFPELTETVGFTFSECENLESVSLSKLQIVGETKGYDFQSCINLKSVYLPAITSIPDSTFRLCESLTGDFYIGENVKSIATYAFIKTDIQSFTVDENNQYIYSDGLAVYNENSLVAFATNNKDINYEIPSKVNIQGQEYEIDTIAEVAMYQVQLNDLIIPETILNIGKLAFSGSVINNLYYNAANCSEAGYYDKETNFIGLPFNEIDTIILGESVEQVPERLFQNTYFDNLIINSHSTVLTTCSFYRFEKQGSFNSIVLNFVEAVDSTYLNMLTNTSYMFYYGNISYLYSKTEVPISSSYRLSNLVYYSYDGTYHVYSEEKLSNKYTITASSNEYGTITPNGVTTYKEGDTAQYIFTANIGCYVKSIIVNDVALTGDDLENAIVNGYTFANITKNHTITAEFALEIYTISYVDGETILGNLSPTTYTYGTSFKLPTPEEKQAYIFVGWYDNPNFTGQPITHILASDLGDKTYYAKYDIKTFTINVIQAENGVISDANSSYDYGSSAHFTITPNSRYRVEYLLIDGEIYTENLNEYTFTNIDKNHTISASFASNDNIKYTVNHWQESLTTDGATKIGTKYYNLVVTDTSKTGTLGELTQAETNTYSGFTALVFEQQNISLDGTVVDILYNRNSYTVNLKKCDFVDSVLGGGDYLFGQEVIISATLKEGCDWISWESSSSEILADSSNMEYSFEMPASDVELTANASIKQFEIIISSTNYGKITPSTNQVVNYGDNLELQFEADSNCELVELLIDGTDFTASVVDNKYELLNIKENHTISVAFDLISYSITAIEPIDGAISPSGVSSVKYGHNKKFTFIADKGYHLESVIIDGEALTNVNIATIAANGYTFASVDKNYTISATFAKNVYTISASTNDYGNISPSGNVQVLFGETKTFIFEANEDYQIDKVYIDGVNIGNVSKYTFYEIDSNHEIYVTFVKIKYAITATCDANGSITPSANLELGDQKRFDFYPRTGYKVKDVKVDGVSIGPADYYVFVNVDSPHTISVEYEIKTFNITLSVDGKGQVKSDEVLESVNYGEERVFTISTQKGWELFKVYVNGESVDVSNKKFTISNIDEDMSIQAIFNKKAEAETNNANSVTIAIVCGTVIISSLLASLLVISRRNVRKRKLEDVMKSGFALESRNNQQTKTSNIQNKKTEDKIVTKTTKSTTSPLLEKAYDFVKDKEVHFASFCKKYNIDYQNDYDNAVLRYYQAYLRSTKK